MGVLDGKVAIVTGAGRLRGIGRATVVELSEELFRRVLDVKVVGSFLFCKAMVW